MILGVPCFHQNRRGLIRLKRYLVVKKDMTMVDITAIVIAISVAIRTASVSGMTLSSLAR